MSARRSRLARLIALGRRATRERDLEAELQFHLDAEAEAQQAAGVAPDDARFAARRDLGSVSVVKEATRDAWGWRAIERLVQDLRYGLRLMRRGPAFTSAAVLSLALGIGANTAIFSLLDLVLLRALPVPQPEQLVIFAHAGADEPSTGANYPIYEMLRRGNRSLSGLVAFWTIGVKLRTGDESASSTGQYVTANYFPVLRVAALRGRVFDEADADRPVAVISYGLWQRRYGGAADVVGRGLTVNGVPLTIVGVTPPEFFGLQRGSAIDAFLPFGLQTRVSPEYGDRLAMRDGIWGLGIVGRLKPDVPAATARAEAGSLVRPWIEEFVLRGTGGRLGNWARVELLPGSRGLDALRRQFSRPLWVLMAMVGAVLLIGCANVAGLLLSRAVARRPEMALRAALGAGRVRLIRQLLTESILLAALGGVCGLLLALWGARALVASIALDPQPLALRVDPDWRVLTFTAAASLLSACVVGVVPALRATRVDIGPALAGGARGRTAGDPVGPWRKLLVATQVALSIVLVVGAGLFVRSLANIRGLATGFNPDQLLLATFDTTGTAYTGDKAQAFYDRVLDRVRALPGVEAASLSRLGPLSGDDATRLFATPAFTPRAQEEAIVHVNGVTPGYFEAMGVSLRDGRAFDDDDRTGAPRVAIISESAARLYFPGRRAIGQTFRLPRGTDTPAIEIVGVSRDMKQGDLREAPPRMVYLPCAQAPACGTLEVRGAAAAGPLESALREAVRAIAPDVPIATLRTTRAQVDASLVQERLIAALSALFGAVALLLAGVGLYGVVSYTVTARTHELGIRIALGASRIDVVRLVMREIGLPVVAGTCLGVAAALALTRTIASMLFGLPARDPTTFLAATGMLLLVAIVAALLPARRATRTDPAAALRAP